MIPGNGNRKIPPDKKTEFFTCYISHFLAPALFSPAPFLFTLYFYFFFIFTLSGFLILPRFLRTCKYRVVPRYFSASKVCNFGALFSTTSHLFPFFYALDSARFYPCYFSACPPAKVALHFRRLFAVPLFLRTYSAGIILCYFSYARKVTKSAPGAAAPTDTPL